MTINWNDIVGSKTLEDGGYVGDFMAVARAHLNEAKDNGEITQGEVGEVYSAMIPSAFQQGLQFAMTRALSEARVTSEIKNQDILETKNTLLTRQVAQLEQQMDTQRQQLENTLLTASKQRDNLVAQNTQLHRTISKVEKDIEVAEAQRIQIKRRSL